MLKNYAFTSFIAALVAITAAQDTSYQSDLKQFCLFVIMLGFTGQFYCFLDELFESRQDG